MFTGIIEETGKLLQFENISGGLRIKISASVILNELKIDDSISVNGVCLTVTAFDKNSFIADAVGATLKKTTIQLLKPGENLNLERALRLNDRLGGHIVQGHVNAVGEITGLLKLGENYSLELRVPKDITKYIVNEGAICIDGISLTVAAIVDEKVTVSIIPHTWNNTNLKNRKTGDKVNIETDVLGKYVEKMLLGSIKTDNRFTDEWFKNLGY